MKWIVLRCQAGGCVQQINICDGHPDCPTYGEDEFFCKQGQCQPLFLVLKAKF